MKINWTKAAIDYAKDETLSYDDIANKYSISKRSVVKHAVRDDWQKLRSDVSLKVHQKLPEILSESIAEINARHAQQAKLLQVKGMEIIDSDKRPRNYQEALNCIRSGIKIEREALGMNDDAVKDPHWEQFKQFSFIFDLSREELHRFIEACDKQIKEMEIPRVQEGQVMTQ